MSRCHPETNRVKGMAKRPILMNGAMVRASLADVQPGGRVRLGDTDPMRSALEDALQFVETMHSTVSGDSRKIVWRCLERGRAALAARQPVGELHLPPDGFYKIVFDDAEVPDESFARSGALDAALRRFEQISNKWNAHLFVRFANNTRDCTVPNATPAQAVGSGQFRAEVADLLRSEFDLEIADPEDHRHDDGSGEADRIAGKIIALLDSQAVGNG